MDFFIPGDRKQGITEGLLRGLATSLPAELQTYREGQKTKKAEADIAKENQLLGIPVGVKNEKLRQEALKNQLKEQRQQALLRQVGLLPSEKAGKDQAQEEIVDIFPEQRAMLDRRASLGDEIPTLPPPVMDEQQQPSLMDLSDNQLTALGIQFPEFRAAGESIKKERADKARHAEDMAFKQKQQEIQQSQFKESQGLKNKQFEASQGVHERQLALQEKQHQEKIEAPIREWEQAAIKAEPGMRRLKNALTVMQQSADKTNWTTPIRAAIAEKLGLPVATLLTTDEETISKASAELIRGVSTYYPGQIRVAEIENEIRANPSLFNSAEGMQKIATLKLNDIRFEEAMRDLMFAKIKEYDDQGLPLPRDLQAQVIKEMAPLADQIMDENLAIIQGTTIPRASEPGISRTTHQQRLKLITRYNGDLEKAKAEAKRLGYDVNYTK